MFEKEMEEIANLEKKLEAAKGKLTFELGCGLSFAVGKLGIVHLVGNGLHAAIPPERVDNLISWLEGTID